MDSGPKQVNLKMLGFGDGGGFWSGDDEDLGEVGVLQQHQRGVQRQVVSCLSNHVSVVGACGVEEEECVAGRRCVHHHEAASAFEDDAGELLEYGDLLGTGGQEVFCEVGFAVGVEILAFGGHDALAVFGGGLFGVDAGDPEVFDAVGQHIGEVGRRVRGGEVNVVAARGEGDRDCGCNRGLADPTLAHTHDQSVALLLQRVDEVAHR